MDLQHQKRECKEEEEQENKKAKGMREMHAEDLDRDKAEGGFNLKRVRRTLSSDCISYIFLLLLVYNNANILCHCTAPK
jgi:hypothetical protein